MPQTDPNHQDYARQKLDYASPMPPLPRRPGVTQTAISLVCVILPLPAVVAILIDPSSLREAHEFSLVPLLIPLAIIGMAMGWGCGVSAYVTARRTGDPGVRYWARVGIILNLLWVIGSTGAVAEDYLFRAYKKHRRIADDQRGGLAAAKEIRAMAQRDGVYPATFDLERFTYVGAGLRPGPALDAVAARIFLLSSENLGDERQVIVFADGHQEFLSADEAAKARLTSDAERAKVILPRPTSRSAARRARLNRAPATAP